MLEAYRDAIIAHTSNSLAIAAVLLKLGVAQRVHTSVAKIDYNQL